MYLEGDEAMQRDGLVFLAIMKRKLCKDGLRRLGMIYRKSPVALYTTVSDAELTIPVSRWSILCPSRSIARSAPYLAVPVCHLSLL